jgi:hypothetical protein
MKPEPSTSGRRPSSRQVDDAEEDEEMEMEIEGETLSPRGNKRAKRAVVDDEEDEEEQQDDQDQEEEEDKDDEEDDAGLLPESAPIVRDVDG